MNPILYTLAGLAALWAACFVLATCVISGDIERSTTMLSVSMAKRLMATTAAGLHDLNDVRELQARFSYQQDNSYGYPTIIEVFQKSAMGMSFPGDCATAAVLGKWSLGVIGIPAKIYVLTSEPDDGGGHAVAISDDHRIVVGNISVAEINPDEFPASLYALWNGTYSKMREVAQ